ESAEFGGGTDIRTAGENRVEGDVAVVERLVARLQPVLFKDLELGRDHEWDEERVDSGRGWHFFQRGAVSDSHSQHVYAGPQRHNESPPRHSPQIGVLLHTFLLPLHRLSKHSPWPRRCPSAPALVPLKLWRNFLSDTRPALSLAPHLQPAAGRPAPWSRPELF